ncbi:hypothetical protein [Bifidobacterium callimiconis]|uniref:PhnA protein n=1 Tax=Bifidobacterium callimiconis TaxID=2306973 RepID=A0A430FIE2_9BIFI|nr:hypothetical protein [Bifidobacterium callimiconis]RSX52664.1 hypothetical protein D2E23_0392 [Bifidobacterium callimiconis]
MPECHCHTPITTSYTLCPACELHLCLLLLQLATDITPLHNSLDATLHPGGHQPTRIQTPTPPTPIRLDILDLLDILDATTYAWLRRLDGTNPLDWTHDRQPEDLTGSLIALAAHPRLATHVDAPYLLRETIRFADKVDRILDPPEQRREIGPCEQCATMLTAGERDQWVTCPVCDREQRVLTVKLRRLERLCFDDSKRARPAMVARAFGDAGIVVRRNTISQWVRRGRIDADDAGLVAYCDVYRLVIAGMAQHEGE